MPDRKPIVGGNWKMNTTAMSAQALAAACVEGSRSLTQGCDVFVSPPSPYLAQVGDATAGSAVELAAQDFYPRLSGAFTGEMGLEMLADLGVQTVLVGHSERRHVLLEPEDLIAVKARAAVEAGLRLVLCIGETLGQREAGETDAVNLRQLSSALGEVDLDDPERLVVAYEPVWAIGTGRTAEPADAEAAHRAIRSALQDRYDERFADSVRIQYGGSVKADNASALISQPNVDGFLVGGASLKADEFLAIIRSAAGGAA